MATVLLSRRGSPKSDSQIRKLKKSLFTWLGSIFFPVHTSKLQKSGRSHSSLTLILPLNVLASVSWMMLHCTGSQGALHSVLLLNYSITVLVYRLNMETSLFQLDLTFSLGLFLVQMVINFLFLLRGGIQYYLLQNQSSLCLCFFNCVFLTGALSGTSN